MANKKTLKNFFKLFLTKNDFEFYLFFSIWTFLIVTISHNEVYLVEFLKCKYKL
jgi:hypothetical protein